MMNLQVASEITLGNSALSRIYGNLPKTAHESRMTPQSFQELPAGNLVPP